MHGSPIMPHSAGFPNDLWKEDRLLCEQERRWKKQKEREGRRERLARERPKGWERRLGLLPPSDPVAKTLARSGKFRDKKDWK